MTPHALYGIAAGLAAGALWGLVFVVPRMLANFGMVDIAASRFVVFGAMSALALMARPARQRWPTGRQAGAALGLSLLGFTGYYVLLAFAVDAIGTAVPSLVIGAIPVLMMLLGRPAGLQLKTLGLGLALTGAGIALMVVSAWPEGGTGGSRFWLGLLLAVLALASWTVFGLLNAVWLQRHPEVAATDWANSLGVASGMGGLLLWLVAGTSLDGIHAQPNVIWFWLIALVSGVGSSWLATLLWNVASQRLSASLCGQLIVSETLFALLYAFMWDGRWPHATEWAAAVLFVLGILASIRAHR